MAGAVPFIDGIRRVADCGDIVESRPTILLEGDIKSVSETLLVCFSFKLGGAVMRG